MKQIFIIVFYLGLTVTPHGQGNNDVGTNSQVITGKVYDNTTGLPVSHANVYLNGSSYFTTTNESGEFYLKVPKKINTQLVISRMAYETLVINDPFKKDLKEIHLIEKAYELSEVVVKPGRFSHQELLKAFELQFLGNNKAGRSCTILNKEDIQVYYDEDDKTLYATNDQPIIVENKYLGYQMHCLLTDFKVHYSNKSLNEKNIANVLLRCNIFFVDKTPDNLIIKKRRDEMYKSSSNYFFKNLANKTLNSSKYLIYNYGWIYVANPDQYFDISDSGSLKIVRIKPNTNISKQTVDTYQFPYPTLGIITVVDPTGGSSDIFFLTDEFGIDAFGLIDKKDYVFISGKMDQRIGNTLPLDYYGKAAITVVSDK